MVGPDPNKSQFPQGNKKISISFFLCLFWLLAGGERNSPAVYFLDIKGGGKQGGGESGLAEQLQTIRAISLGLADPLELILARLQFGVFTTERLFLNKGWVWREKSL